MRLCVLDSGDSFYSSQSSEFAQTLAGVGLSESE